MTVPGSCLAGIGRSSLSLRPQFSTQPLEFENLIEAEAASLAFSPLHQSRAVARSQFQNQFALAQVAASAQKFPATARRALSGEKLLSRLRVLSPQRTRHLS